MTIALETSTEPVAVHCASCRATAEAIVHRVAPPIAGGGSWTWLALPPGWTVLLPVLDVTELHCRCPDHGFARAPKPEPRKPPVDLRGPSARIEGRWYVTGAAAEQYAQLMRPRPVDVETATDELIALSATAHLVREQDNGLELWRVRAANGARIRLLVGEPTVRGGKPALVRVLGEHGGAKRRVAR